MAKFKLRDHETMSWNDNAHLINGILVRNGRLYITSERLVFCSHSRAATAIPIWYIVNLFFKPKRIRYEAPLSTIRSITDGKNFGFNKTIEVTSTAGDARLATNNKLDAAGLSQLTQPNRAAA